MSKKIVLIHEAGGKALVASGPLTMEEETELDAIVRELVQLRGIDVTITIGRAACLPEAEQLFFAAEKVLAKANVKKSRRLAKSRKRELARDRVRRRMQRANWEAIRERFPKAVVGLQTPFNETEISSRLANKLESANIYFVWELALYGIENFLTLKGVSKNAGLELLDVLVWLDVPLITTVAFKYVVGMSRSARLPMTVTKDDLVVLEKDWFPR